MKSNVTSMVYRVTGRDTERQVGKVLERNDDSTGTVGEGVWWIGTERT